MIINPYEFDNANASGDKEAVIVPNVPTLVNKLSANETNGIRDKINEVVAQVNLLDAASGVVQFLELRLKLKGSQGGIANVLPTLEVGDVVYGFASAGTIWTNAIYIGGDPALRSSYENVESEDYVKKSFGANHDFTDTGDFAQPLIPVDGQSTFTFTEDSLNSIQRLSDADLITDPLAEQWYVGKLIVFYNRTDTPKTLLTSSDPYGFAQESGIGGGNPIIMPPGGRAVFVFTGYFLLLVGRSWGDVVQGYYNGTNFYSDAGFTTLINPDPTKLYISKNGNLSYRYEGGYKLIAQENQISITTAVSITTNTSNQNGKNVKIKNGVNAINIVCEASSDAEFVASYQKMGSANVTFTAGVGVTLNLIDGTAVMTGSAKKQTAAISRDANEYSIQISNR